MTINISWKMLGQPQQAGDVFIPKLGIVKISEKDIKNSKICPMGSYQDLSVDLLHFQPSHGDKGNGYYKIYSFTSVTYMNNNSST